MRWTIAIALGVLALGCAQINPAPVVAGDVCARCKAPITQPLLAGEIIDAGSNVLKFRTVSCMAKYFAEHRDRVKVVFVTDYPSGKLFRAQNGVFVRSVVDEKTNAEDYLAFSNVQDASAAARQSRGAVVDWPSVLTRVASEPGN